MINNFSFCLMLENLLHTLWDRERDIENVWWHLKSFFVLLLVLISPYTDTDFITSEGNKKKLIIYFFKKRN